MNTTFKQVLSSACSLTSPDVSIREHTGHGKAVRPSHSQGLPTNGFPQGCSMTWIWRTDLVQVLKQMGKQWKQWHFIFLGSKITEGGDCSHEIKRCFLLGRKAMTNLDSILKSRDITLATKVRLVKDMVFPVVIYGCESWTIKKAECWRTDAFELWCWRKTLESPLDCKKIKPVNPKGNQSWIFIRRTDAEAEAPILWPPDMKSWLTGKDPDAGKTWRWEEKGTTEDEMVGWHHWLNGHEFE